MKQMQSAESLQLTFEETSNKYKVWPAGVSFDQNNPDHIVITKGDRCNCWRRIDFDIQCKHEFRINSKFKLNHWSNRWYNRREFNKQFPNLSNFHSHSEVIDIEDNDCHNGVSITNEDTHNLAMQDVPESNSG